jgi:hypothetical protein
VDGAHDLPQLAVTRATAGVENFFDFVVYGFRLSLGGRAALAFVVGKLLLESVHYFVLHGIHHLPVLLSWVCLFLVAAFPVLLVLISERDLLFASV